MNFESLKDVLIFAIRKEHDARELYLMFRDVVKDPAAKTLLGDLADQELGHKTMLEKALESGSVDKVGKKGSVQDLHITDYVPSVKITSDSRPEDIMAYAIKMEEASYGLYQSLLKNYEGTDLAGILSQLIREEMSHKELLEREYEEHFMYWM